MPSRPAPMARAIAAPVATHEAWQTLSEWAARLRQAPAPDRARLLGELRDRLPSLIEVLERSGADRAVLRPLREPLDALRAAFPVGVPRGVELEIRWTRARAVLEVFEQRQGLVEPVFEQPARSERTVFWKR